MSRFDMIGGIPNYYEMGIDLKREMCKGCKPPFSSNKHRTNKIKQKMKNKTKKR